MNDFFAFEQGLRNGCYVTIGDIDGDGSADMIFGGGPGGGPRVYALSGKEMINGNSGNAQLANWWDDGVNLIAFSRGSRGWIALNNHATAQTHTFDTGLRPGTYRDIIHGTTVTVDSHHRATVTVPGKDAVAIDTGSLVRTH